MKRDWRILMALCAMMVLAGCFAHRNPYPARDLSTETWQHQVDRYPGVWTVGADQWFLKGDPNQTEMQNREAPYSSAMSTMMVKVPDDFTRIRINGSFQVQIFGTSDHNSVYLYGPNSALRSVAVNVYGDLLDLSQVKDAPPSMHQLIVRIGIRDLTELAQSNCMASGCGLIEGVRINSHQLLLNVAGQSNIYLSGDLNLRRVIQQGNGKITLLGVDTNQLTLLSNGAGTMNLGGKRVGLQSIVHHSTGNMNIIGATSRRLTIAADGSGKVGVVGSRIQLTELNAKDHVNVYVMGIESSSLSAYAFGNANVGLSGYAGTGHLYASNSAKIFAKGLGLEDAFVRASDRSHINVTARNRLFASATGNASIYYYGQPNSMSPFVSSNGVIIPIWDNTGDVSGPRYKDSGSFKVHRYRGEGIRQSVVSGSF